MNKIKINAVETDKGILVGVYDQLKPTFIAITVNQNKEIILDVSGPLTVKVNENYGNSTS